MNRIEFFADLLNKRGATLGVEVGTALGGFSFPLADRWRAPNKILYQVDLWGATKEGQERIPLEEQELRYMDVCSTAAQRLPRDVRPLRMSSEDGSHHFEDGELCFVYLDADHSSEGVAEDIRLWWPKVKSGGILAGHDYLQGNVGGVEYGVKAVVDAFAALNGLVVSVVNEEWPSWYIFKPEHA